MVRTPHGVLLRPSDKLNVWIRIGRATGGQLKITVSNFYR